MRWYYLTVLLIIISGCQISTVENLDIPDNIDKTLLIQSAETFGFEGLSLVSVDWKTVEIVMLEGAEVNSEFLYVSQLDGQNTYCPISIEYYDFIPNVSMYNFCELDYQEPSSEIPTKIGTIDSMLSYTGRTENTFEEVYNNTSLSTETIQVIDLTYQQDFKGRGCSVTEAHLYLNNNYEPITGTITDEICIG